MRRNVKKHGFDWNVMSSALVGVEFVHIHTVKSWRYAGPYFQVLAISPRSPNEAITPAVWQYFVLVDRRLMVVKLGCPSSPVLDKELHLAIVRHSDSQRTEHPNVPHPSIPRATELCFLLSRVRFYIMLLLLYDAWTKGLTVFERDMVRDLTSMVVVTFCLPARMVVRCAELLHNG